ncbi:MAG TPA: efflux RND transporter permease subunit [Nitrospirae bacterium]|nr:multidrug resistance protein MexB [bacterium BMS3Abin09]GBE41896.1 multidrug resistance protein MexB [bacterium BMS3Bbin09]HDH34432.1 efflux RND transporter permease subunit [Nitrospirota bacterium]HDZ84023.1 efflux RND transporter permease subunit [Nitrospirota bacterium]
MNRQIKWMANNHVAANLLMLIFIIGGLVMTYSIKQEVFPEIELEIVQVTVAYPGAGPEEVEDGIVLKIEESLSSLTGIKEITSVAGEGSGTVSAEILDGENIDLILQDIKAEVDRITTFPEDAEKPIVTKIARRREVVSIVVYGDAPERSLRENAESIRDELLAMPGITQADITGVRPYEISIDVREDTLRKYNLTLEQIAGRIRQASIDLPGGAVKAKGGEILIRTKEKRYTGPEYAAITILEKSDGTELRLGDIADVRDGFMETDQYSRLNGLPSAMVAIYRVGDQKPLDISAIVKNYVEQKRPGLPDSIKLAIWNDYSDVYRSRMDLLLRNAFFGLILIFIILGLFLQIRLAMWVMLGIPISFLGALLLMPGFDVSINMISLFAFILALGIVVDDAIIVGENVFTHRRMKKSYMNAAIDGTIEVGNPVIFSVLTTVAAFLPLIFVSGTMGKFIKVIPLVVIPILLISLVESLLILPAHLALGKESRPSWGPALFITRVREGFSKRLERFINGPYKNLLTICTRHRYTTLAAALAILLITIGLVGGGIIRFHFMPEVDANIITATIKMPIGTPVEETAKAHDLVVKKAEEIVLNFDKERPEGNSILRHIFSVVGGSMHSSATGDSRSTATNSSSVAMLLTKAEKRDVPSADIARKWREAVGSIPGADSVTFASSLVHFGNDIDIRIAHEDFEVLSDSVDRIKTALADYPGVSDIDDNHTKGKRELKLRLKSEARTLGITEAELGRQIRSAFYGSEALRLQRGRNEIKVMVRYPEDERMSLSDLESMRIRTPGGIEVPFSQAASVEKGRGFSEINRADRKRVINVTASVDSKIANAEDILADMSKTVLKALQSDHPGLSYDLEGQEKERRDSLGSLLKGFLMAQFLIYCLLAIPFRSYLQPFIIMSAIPFGFVGAILGHLMLGFNLSILSMFGLVALTGVVVNDSLLLVNFTNELRKSGTKLHEAVIQAAQRRFRPIILTSLTTSLGLTPIIIEKSMQAQFLIPMAISLGFGILFATLITLLLVPSLYLILEDLLELFKRKRQGIEEI